MSVVIDLDLLKTFGQIAAPAGLAIGAFLYLGRDIVAKNIFPTITKEHAYHIIIILAFMAWTIALAGIGSWTYVTIQSKKETEPTTILAAVASLTEEQRELLEKVRLASERATQAAQRAREAEIEAEREAANARSSPTASLVVDDYESNGAKRHYEGQWAKGMPYGFGVMSWSGTSASTGEKFAGQFIEGRRAIGVFSYPPIASNTSEVKRYEGQWAPTSRNPAGNWNGVGVIKYRDRSFYSGDVIDGERQGFGRLQTANGDSFDGRWNRDQLDEIDRIHRSKTGQILGPG
jgi:hypothetical protein